MYSIYCIRRPYFRITIPGQEFASKFSRAPEEHYFPTASVGNKAGMAVSVRSLPRSNDIPKVLCTHLAAAAAATEEEEGGGNNSLQEESGKLAIATAANSGPGPLVFSDPIDLRRSLVRAKLVGWEQQQQQQQHLQPHQQLSDCPGRLIKSDSMDSMLGDSLLDPPQSLSKMTPKRYQSPSRCGSPSLEAPDHLLSGRRGGGIDLPPPPSYEQSLAARMEEQGGQSFPADMRLNRHDIMRRRDMNLFLGLHPRLLTGPPRFSLPTHAATARSSPVIPCRAMAYPPPATSNPPAASPPPTPPPMSDRLPEHCKISGKHICEFEELEEACSGNGTTSTSGGQLCPSQARVHNDHQHQPLDLSSESSGSPPTDNYQQAELGAKKKGWTSRPEDRAAAATPYRSGGGRPAWQQRDSSSDGGEYDPRLKSSKTGWYGPLDLSSTSPDDRFASKQQRPPRMSPPFYSNKSRTSSPQPSTSCKFAGGGGKLPFREDEYLDGILSGTGRRRSSIDELLEPQGLRVEPNRITQVWRAQLPQTTPSPLELKKKQRQQELLIPSEKSFSSFKQPQERSLYRDEEEEEEDEEEENFAEEEEESKADILLGAILKHSRRRPPHAFDPPLTLPSSNGGGQRIHSDLETSAYDSPPSPLTPDINPPLLQRMGEAAHPSTSALELGDLCAELETKCLISKQQLEQKQQQLQASHDKENVANNNNGSSERCCYSSPARTRSYSEASSPFNFSFGAAIPSLEPLDMSFDDFEDHLSLSLESVNDDDDDQHAAAAALCRSRSEKRRNSVEDDAVPSANKKAAFRKSFDSATSMVFHSRNGLPLTSSPAPMRRRGAGGSIKFDFDSGITTPKDIKRALFESQPLLAAEEQQDNAKKKKKKRDPRRLLSTSAPASVTGNNLLCNFEESVLNGRLEPVSTVEGFTAEIGASGSFHPKHSTFPVTVFFYTLCENSNIASPYLVRHFNYKIKYFDNGQKH